MGTLSASHISKAYGTDSILKDITFTLEPGERVGLIGRNGAGKTTFFKILTGQLEKDSGQVWVQQGKQLGYLRQETGENNRQTLRNYCIDVFSDLLTMEEQLKLQEDQIHSADHATPEFNGLLNAYHDSVEKFEYLGGYTFRSRVVGVLKGLGFNDEEMDRSCDTLSGGQLTRLSIARLLLSSPDILLLDEPTNHLDIAAVNWLEGYLKQYSGALLLITHDRFFLDQVTTRIVEIENGVSLSHQGNYSKFQEFKKHLNESKLNAYEKQQNEILKQEELIRRFKQHGTEKLAKRAQSREKKLENLVKIEVPEAEESVFNLSFQVSAQSGYDVLKAENLCMSFGTTPIFSNVTFDIFKGERVGLIGPNGIGKTTLLKILQNQLPPSSGSMTKGHNVIIGSYDQNLRFANESHHLLDELSDFRPDLTDTRLRTLLGSFLFTGADVFKSLHNLSGGEKARLNLIKLLLGTSNFLVMDEPTNHLDISAREVLEDALAAYEGTLLVVSHDRYFLDRVCDKIIAMAPEGTQCFAGNYSYYLSKSANMDDLETSDPGTINRTQQKEQRRRDKDAERAVRESKKEIKNLEAQIEGLEQQIHERTLDLCLEEVYADPERSVAVQQAINNLKIMLDETYARWNQMIEKNKNLV